MANIQDLINQARQNAQAKAEQIKQQSQQNQAAEQSRREQQRQKAIAAREEYYNRRNENLRNEFGFDTLEQDAGNQEQKLKRLYDNYRNGNYISDREFEDVLNSNKDMESRLGKYKDYLSLNKQDTSSVDGTIKNYREIARELNSLRNYMSQFSNPEEYTTNWDNVTYGEKYKGTSLADIDKAIGSTTGREQTWLTNHRYDYATSDDIQRELDALEGSGFWDKRAAGVAATDRGVENVLKTLNNPKNPGSYILNGVLLGLPTIMQKLASKEADRFENTEAGQRGAIRNELEALRDVKKRTEAKTSYEDLALGKESEAATDGMYSNDPMYSVVKKYLDTPKFSKTQDGNYSYSKENGDGDLIDFFESLEKRGAESVSEDFPVNLAATPTRHARRKSGDSKDYSQLQQAFTEYRMMTPDERRILQTLKDNYGSQAAVNYFATLKVELDKRKDEQTQRELREFNDSLPGLARFFVVDIGGSLASVPANTFSGVLALGSDIFDKIVGNDYNPYGGYHTAQAAGQYLRNQVSENIENIAKKWDSTKFAQLGIGDFKPFDSKLGDKTVASEVYQGIMSGADSALGASTLGSAYLATMGIGAAEAKAKEAYEAGRSNESIFISAIMAGAAEIITEKMGYDRLVGWIKNPQTIKQIARGVVKSIIPEAAEEITSDIINDVTDAFVNAGNTDIDKEIKKIMEEQDVDFETAQTIAYRNKVVDYLWSGAGGAIASLVGATKGAVKSARAASIGKTITNANLVESLLEMSGNLKASELDVGDIIFESSKSRSERQQEVYDMLQEARSNIEKALENGENPSYGDVGTLAQLAGFNPTAEEIKKAGETYVQSGISYNNRVKRKTINDIGSMAGLSNNQFKYEIKKNGFKNRFNTVIGVNLDTEGLSLVDKMNIVKAASETADSIRSDEATAQIAESLDKDPSYQNRKKIIDAVNRNKIAPITERQKDLDRNSKEYLALEAQKNVYKILCDDVRSRGKSGATAFFEANGKNVAEDRSLQALPGYGKLTPKAKETIDALGKVTYQSLGDVKVSGKNNQAAVQEMRSELAARNQLERDETARRQESARRDASEKYRKNLTKFSDQAKSVFKKYGIDLNVSHKGEKDTYRITLSDGSVVENENRAEATNPREWARNAVGIITLYDDIDAGRVTPINYLNGNPLDGRTAEFLAGHEGAHFAIAKDVNLIGRTIESLKGTSLDIYGLNDANVRFNESTGRYELDVSGLNDNGQRYFEQMRKNILEHSSRADDHDILEEIVCDMYGSVIASDSFTRTLAEGTRLGNLVRRAIDRFAKTRLGMKIIKPGKKANQVNEVFDKAEEWVKKFDAIRERAEKFAPKRSDNDAQKTSSTVEALLSDLKRDGVKTDLSALDEKYLKRLISAEDKVAEAQKILAELGEDAGAARPALENLIKEKPRTGSTESRLDEQMNAIVENAPKQRRKNKAVEEAKTLEEAQAKAIEAFESEPSLDTEPMDESVEPIDTNEIKEVVGADPETIVDIPKNSMSTMFEGCGFDVPTPRFDENGTLQNDPLTITYRGKTISRDEMTGEFIRSTDSPVMTLLNSSKAEGLLTDEQITKITDDFADIIRSAMYFGDTGGGVSAIDTIWRWATKDGVFKPVKKNSDDQYSRSIDFQTICKKTEELLGIVSQYQVDNKHGMTPSEVMRAYYETGAYVREDGSHFQTPCPLCYVFSHWIDNGKLQQTQYTAQQYYADTKKSGLKYKALTGEELSKLSDEEREDYLNVWIEELNKQQKFADSNKKIINKAKNDVKIDLGEFDRIFKQYAVEKDESKKKALENKLNALNERYVAAANLLAYSDFAGWIKSNILKQSKNDYTLFDDYKEVPSDLIFDYFRIAECYDQHYNGYLRFRASKGSDAGKGIETETNNTFGDVIAGLSVNDPKDAVNKLNPIFEEGISDSEREKREKEFRKQFSTAIRNARRQSLIGGQRFFSWSDNRIEFGPDMFSAFVQLQTLGCSVQSYTKQLEGLNLIAQMGGYVNGSLIAKGKGYTGSFKDGTGKLVFSNVQGIKHEETFKLNKLNDKAGNILVGMSDEHVLIALASDEVFFVIPYHRSGLKAAFLKQMMAMLGEPVVSDSGNEISIDRAATDYTPVQGENVPGRLSSGKEAEIESVPIKKRLSSLWNDISKALDRESEKGKYNFDFLNKNRIPNGIDELSEEQVEYRKLRERIILDQITEEDKGKIEQDPFLSQVYNKIHESYTDAEGKPVPVSMTSKEVDAIYPYEYWDESTTYENADVNGMRYLEYCRRLGVQPKFSGDLSKKELSQKAIDTRVEKGLNTDSKNFALRDGEFVKGYWKLLIDRRMYRNVYDADGNWVSYNGEYEGTDSVRADNFTMDTILPAATDEFGETISSSLEKKTGKKFEQTTAADKESFKTIADLTKKNLKENGVDVDRFYIETSSQEEALENYADLKNSMSLDDWENNPEADHRVAEGIYVSNEGKNKFSDWILDGKKTIETRNMSENGTGTLDPFVGRRVGVITDGKLVGYVTISRRVEFDKKNWGKYRDKHLVPTGSDYDIANSPTGKKVGYVLSNPVKLKNPIDIKYEGNRTRNTIRPKDAKGPTFVSFFTGGGTVDNVVAPYVDQIAVAELDPKMTSAFALNYSGNVENLGYLTHDEEGNVIGMDVRKFLKNTKLRKGDVFAFHSSPCCQNFSSAKADRGEKDVNRETAQATADFIDMVEPYVVTIENVEGYKSSDSVQIILDALKRNGYKTNGIEILEATDFGAAASRKRLFIRAVKDGGVMPDLSEFHRPAKGWYEVLKDRVDNPDYFKERAALPDHVMKGVKEDGIDLNKKNQQILMAGRTNDREKYFAGRESRPSRLIMSYGNEPAKTFTASERQYLAVINGKVYDVQPRAIATLMGLSDSFTLPENKVDAFHLIGNGVSGELTSAVVTPLIRDNWEQLESKGELDVKNSSSMADAYQPLTEEQTEWGRLNNESKEVGSPLYNMSGNLQGRWKNSVGKEAGGIYVHKNYAKEVAAKLFGSLDTLRKAEQIAKEKGIDYTCVMLDKSKPNIVRFDESPNFDTADEPIPGNTYTVNVTDGTAKEGFSDRIWHHKWMWVKNDYKGFNVEDSWNRSKEYLNRIRKLDAPKGSLEYEMSHNGTANGSARGYDKWNEQLEYFGIESKHSMSAEDERYLKDMYGLDEFKLATPTAGWKQTLLKNDAEKIMPDLWKKTEQKVENNEKAGRDPTQRPITVSSYRNVFTKLKEEGFNGTILDASSGLGLGTKAGREEPFNFDVDDVELYPEESYNPRYRSYADIKKKYDVIISNAVLNVLPQDYRDALVTKMGQLLNDGGRMFINVRSTDVNNVGKDRNINTGENEWLIPKDGSYQKGFLKSELVAYLKDALGDGFTVIPYNGLKGGTWALVTKNDKIKASPAITATNESGRQSAGNALNANNYTTNSSESQEVSGKNSSSVDSEGRKLTEEQEEYFADSKIRDERGRLVPVYHGTKAAGFTRFRRQFRRGRSGALFFTDSPDIAAGYAELDPDKNRIVHPSLGWVIGGKGVFKFYLNVTNPLVKDFSEEPRAWDALYEGNPDLYFTSVFVTDQDGDRYNVDFYFDSQEKKYDKFEPGWYTREQLNKLIGEKNAADLVNYDEIRGLALDKDKNRLLSTTDDWAEYAEANGYDGVVFKGIIDDASGFAEPSNVYAAFESKQAKDTRNTEPSDSGDFRYSSSVELLNPDSDEIRNISRMVDEARDRLKKASQRTPTGETASTSEYIRNVITNVIDNTQTGMTYDQIRDRLAEIYRYVYFKSEKKNGKFSTVPFSINTAWENLYSLANDIVNSAFEPAFTEDETAMFKDIYKRIRANALFKPAPGKHFAKATGVSIEDLIRNSPQKAKDSLNELYESLVRDYPGLFPVKAEDIFDRYNQLRETAKQMNDSAKAKVQWAENHQTELEGIVTATALQLAGAIDKSYDEKALPRFAKKLNTLINRYEDDIEKLRDRILSIIRNDRRKDDRAKAFRRLAIAARTLGRPTRARHFNENLKPIAKTLLESVVPKLPHRTKGETELYNTLNGLVRYAKTTDVNDYKDEFTQPIDDLKDAVDRFVQASKQYNSFDELSDQMYSDLSKLLYRLAHLSNVMNKSLYFDKGYRELSTQAAAEIRATRKAVTNSAPQKVIQWLESAALDPVSGFNVIGSDTLTECFKNIVRSQNDFTKTLNGWIIQMKDIVGDKVKPDWHNQADEYVFSQGKLKLTKGELMYLYLLAQQDDSWTCLTGSGAKPVVNDNLVERLGKGASSLAKDTVGEVKNKLSAFSKAKENVKYEMKKNFGKTIAHQNPVRFSEGDKMRIRSYLGTEAVEMCDRISLLLNGDVAKAGNEVSRKMEGYEKFNIAHYVPMIVDRNGNYEESTKNLGVYLAQPGFTKERDGRSKVLVLDDLFNVVEKHLLGMAQYSAFNEATADLVRIYANKYKGGSVAGVVNESFANGSPAKKFMENFITDIQGQQMNANIEPLAIERYLARYKKAAVAANLSTVAKQPTAIMRAFPEFSMKAIRKMHIGKGLIKSITDRDIAEMCEHSGLAMMKSWGFSENASPKSLRQLYDVNEAKRAENLFNNAVSWGAEKADMITWAAIWRAAKFDTMKDGKEDLEAAAEKFNDVIVKTQVVNTATTTTRIAYQEGLAKLYFAFKNEPLKTFNYMRTALVNFARNKDAASFGRMLKTMVCAGLNSSVTAFITAAFSMLRDEEDDTDELIAKFIVKWEASTLDDLIENVTIFTTDVIQAIKDATSPYGSTNISTAAVTDTVKSFYALLKDGSKPQNERTKTWYHHAYNLTKGLSELTGIPVRTFMRSVKSVCYATVNMKGDPYLKYLVTKAYYNANGYDSADAKAEFKAILTDALNHQDWEGYAKVKKKLQYHGYSSTDFDSAIKLSDVFVNAYNEGNLSRILKEARKYDDSLTEEKILKLIKSTNTSEITNLFNEMKAHGESSDYRKLKKELLGKKNPETGKNYTEKEIEKLIEKKVESALKSDLSKRLAGILQTDPLWTEIVGKLAKEYSRLGVTEDDVKKIARGL